MNVPYGFWEECVNCCWMKWSINSDYIQLIDGVVEFSCIFTGFLPAGSVENSFEVSDYDSKFISPCSSIRCFYEHFMCRIVTTQSKLTDI